MPTQPNYQNVEIPRDRWGRPMIMQPNGKRLPYRRTTTYVGCLDDMNGLMKWKARQVAIGMGQRKDLVLAAAAARPDDNKTLNDVAEAAAEHARASSAATTGTALHTLTERIDQGETIGQIPSEYAADIDAYRRATEHIEWHGIENFRVHDELQVAGTADRLGLFPGSNMLRICDIKTGSVDFPHKMCMQLAMYSRMVPYDIATDQRTLDPMPIDTNTGIIIHLPAGKGECTLYEIDLVKGWGACRIARKVWEWRNTKGLTTAIDSTAPPSRPPTWESLALDATTTNELRIIWNRAKECGDLNDDLKELLTQRSAALKAAS